MQIPRRILERNFKFVLACLKDKPHEVIEVTDGAGIVLFCILSTSQKGKNLSTQVESVDKQIKKPVDTVVNTPTRKAVFDDLKKKYATSTPTQQEETTPTTPAPSTPSTPSRHSFGQSPYGRADLRPRTNWGA